MALTVTSGISDGTTYPTVRPKGVLYTSGETTGATLNVYHRWSTDPNFGSGVIAVDDTYVTAGLSVQPPTSDLTYGLWNYKGEAKELNTQQIKIGYPDVAASASKNSAGAVNAIDRDTGTVWLSNNNMAVGDWIKVDWGVGIQVDEIKALTNHSDDFPQTVDIEGSNDDSSWTPILTGQTYVGSGTWNDWTFTAATYRYWRIKVATRRNKWWRVNEIEFYLASTLLGAATGGTWTVSDGISTTSPIAFDASAATVKTRLETDIANFTTVEVSGSGTFWDPYVVTVVDPAVKVPLVVDATLLTPPNSEVVELIEGSCKGADDIQTVTLGTFGPSITPSGSASNNGGSIGNALDGVVDSKQYSSNTSQYVGMYVQFDFGQAVKLTNIRQYCQYGSNMSTDYPRNWKTRYSDDGTNWTDDSTGSATSAGILDTAVVDTNAHQYWRIELTSGVSNWWRVNEFEFTFADELPTAGTWTLSDGVDTTSPIAFDASAATVETRLETDIGSITDVTVTGTGGASDPFVVTFVDPSGAVYPYPQIGQLVGDFSALTPPVGSVATVSSGGPEVGKATTPSSTYFNTVDPKSWDQWLYTVVNLSARVDGYLPYSEDGWLYTVVNVGAQPEGTQAKNNNSFLYTVVNAQYELSHTVDGIIVASLQTKPGKNIPEVAGIVGFDPSLPVELSMNVSGLGTFAIVKLGYGAFPVPYPLGVDNTNVLLALQMRTGGQSNFRPYLAFTSTNMNGVGGLSLTVTNQRLFGGGIVFSGTGTLSLWPYTTSTVSLGVTFPGESNMSFWGFSNPLEAARFLYLYLSVGVGFDPTDVYSGSANVVSETFPDGDTKGFDRWLYQLLNVGVGFDPTDDSSARPDFLSQTFPDGATVDFDRWLYHLINVVDWVKNPGRGRFGLAPRLPASLYRAFPPQIGHP